MPAAVSVVAMLVARLSGGSAVGWGVAWTSAAVSALAGTLLARQAAPDGSRGRWTLWAAAAGSWLCGQVLADIYWLAGTPQCRNLKDLFMLAFAVLVMVSMVRMPARSRSLRVVTAAELLPMIAAAIALILALLWHDVFYSAIPIAPLLTALAYPALYVSAAVLTLQAAIGNSLLSVRSPASRLVLAGIVVQAVAFIFWGQQLLEHTYVPGHSWLDPLWVLGLLAIAGGGALAAKWPEAVTIGAEEPGTRSGVLPAAMFVLLIIALVHTELQDAPDAVLLAVDAGLVFSGIALILRGALLQSRLRGMLGRERSALASLADREAELARLNERLMEDSRRDPLTGMRNRRALADELPGLEAAHREHDDAFAVALCDVDHFKAYNDELGHLAGDQALRAIAATIRGALRAQDLAYRFGGEELLLVLPGAGPEEAAAAAQRVRAAVEAAAMPHPTGIGGVVTVSMGVASGTVGYGELVARADAALYDAKRGGRNRVVIAAGEPDPARAEQPRDRAHNGPGSPGHLHGMLALSRAAASGHGVLPVLEALAHLIRSELSFQVVSINLLDDAREEFRALVVEGDEEARQTLLGTASPWSEWEDLLTSDEYARHGAIWLPAGAYEWPEEPTFWTPAAAAAPDPDAWHPDDMLLLPLRGAAGDVLGIVSIDQPLHGRRPEDPEVEVLMAVADQAGLAVERAQLEAAGESAAREQSPELRLAAVMLLAETLDLRDAGTAQHSRTVGVYARCTALALGLSSERVERIHAAGVLHDLGKLGIADAILHKPGALDDAEWKEIQRHPEIGARILEHSGLADIALWVRAHHERVDGRGYPMGLSADEIPFEARILAVADAYEAMVADRPYRAGMPAAEAAEELVRCAGTQFDATVVEAFLAALDRGEAELHGEPVARVA